MPKIKVTEAWRVDVIEYERGWGQRLDETIYFDNKSKAEEWVRNYNKRNNLPEVPDWYMAARLVGRVT